MKKAITIIVVCVAALLILIQSGVIDSLMLFVLGGIVPGTNYVVPSTFMLFLMASVAWLVLFSFIPSDIFIRSSTKQRTTEKQAAKTRLPKQRFKQV